MGKHITPWTKIKAEYLQGVTPKELAEKYKIEVKAIHEKSSKEKWTKEKSSISKNLQVSIQDRIEKLTNLALDAVESVLKDNESSNNDKIQASKVIVDISGLKTAKKEVELNTNSIEIELI